MKKLAIVALSFAALALCLAGGTSYYIGQQVEHALQTAAEAWSRDDDFSVHVVSYDRGIVQSRAKSLWVFTQDGERYEITAEHTIVHGPWAGGHAASVQSAFHLPPDSEPTLLKALSQQAPLTWDTTLHWDRSTQHHLHAPAFSVAFPDQSELQWGGLESRWSLSSERDALQGQLYLPELRIRADDGSSLDIVDASLRFDVHAVAMHTIWQGPVQLHLGMLRAQDADGTIPLDLEQLRVYSDSSLVNGLMNWQLRAEIAQLRANDFAATEGTLKAQLTRIQPLWLDHLLTWWLETTDPDEATQALLEQTELLLSSHPLLVLSELQLRTTQGDGKIQAHLGYPPPASVDTPSLPRWHASLQGSGPPALIEYWLSRRVRADYLELLEQMGEEISEEDLQQAIQHGVSKRLAILLEHHALEAHEDRLHTDLQLTPDGVTLNNRSSSLESLANLFEAI